MRAKLSEVSKLLFLNNFFCSNLLQLSIISQVEKRIELLHDIISRERKWKRSGIVKMSNMPILTNFGMQS